jgi:hypothetical protein
MVGKRQTLDFILMDCARRREEGREIEAVPGSWCQGNINPSAYRAVLSTRF